MSRRIQTPHFIFNNFDELGLLSGLNRDPGESNLDFKQRLADFWKENPSSTQQGLVGALSVELGLTPYNVIDKKFFWLEHLPVTPSGVSVFVDGQAQEPQLVNYLTLPSGWPDVGVSEYYETASSGWIVWQDVRGDYTQLLEFIEVPDGAFVTVEYTYDEGGRLYTVLEGDENLEIQDPVYGLDGHWKIYKAETPDASSQVIINSLNDQDYLFDTSNGLVDALGLPTTLLKRIVALIQNASPISWGKFVWDEAYFQEDPESIETLPSLFDAGTSGYVSETDLPDFQSGVGGDSQLMIIEVVEALDASVQVELHPSGAIF